MIVDKALPQMVTNFGKVVEFATETKQNLYLGGIPNQMSKKALVGFHLKQTHSLHGISDDLHASFFS